MSKPIASMKLFPIDVAIWEGKYGPSISINKRFKDKQTGEYKNTNFLSVGDAIIAHRLLGAAIDRAIAMEGKAATRDDLNDLVPDRDPTYDVQHDPNSETPF